MHQILPFRQRHLTEPAKPDQQVACSRTVLSELLIQQWKKLTPGEIEKTRFVKRSIALLIENKYGIDHALTENYLSNIEHTLPQAA